MYYAGKPINKVKLSGELLEKAKKSNISKYIKDGCIVVYDKDAVKLPDHVAKALATGSTKALNSAMQFNTMGYPTYEKCEKIKCWICNIEYEAKIDGMSERSRRMARDISDIKKLSKILFILLIAYLILICIGTIMGIPITELYWYKWTQYNINQSYTPIFQNFYISSS